VGHHGLVRDRDFERLYAEHAQGLLGFLVYKTGDRALSEDLLADAYERVLRTRTRFDRRRGSEKTWIYAIALNCLRDHSRRGQAEQRAIDRVGAPVPGRADGDPGGYEAVDQRDALARALQTLPEDEREALALRYGGDMTVPEIARLTGQPLTTVEGRVYRALRKLRNELG
jgi:RNA polymerase sigma factor (sigma-70 family)